MEPLSAFALIWIGLSVGVIVGLVIWQLTEKSLMDLLVEFRTRPETYKVAVFENGLSAKSLYLCEGDKFIPIESSRSSREKIVGFVNANPTSDLYITAKVDRNNLRILSVQGYALKDK